MLLVSTWQGSTVAVGSSCNELEGEQGKTDSLDMDLHTIFMGDKLMLTWDKPARNIIELLNLKIFFNTNKFG